MGLRDRVGAMTALMAVRLRHSRQKQLATSHREHLGSITARGPSWNAHLSAGPRALYDRVITSNRE
jgi:hypothetical protein